MHSLQFRRKRKEGLERPAPCSHWLRCIISYITIASLRWSGRLTTGMQNLRKQPAALRVCTYLDTSVVVTWHSTAMMIVMTIVMIGAKNNTPCVRAIFDASQLPADAAWGPCVGASSIPTSVPLLTIADNLCKPSSRNCWLNTANVAIEWYS